MADPFFMSFNYATVREEPRPVSSAKSSKSSKTSRSKSTRRHRDQSSDRKASTASRGTDTGSSAHPHESRHSWHSWGANSSASTLSGRNRSSHENSVPALPIEEAPPLPHQSQKVDGHDGHGQDGRPEHRRSSSEDPSLLPSSSHFSNDHSSSTRNGPVPGVDNLTSANEIGLLTAATISVPDNDSNVSSRLGDDAHAHAQALAQARGSTDVVSTAAAPISTEERQLASSKRPAAPTHSSKHHLGSGPQSLHSKLHKRGDPTTSRGLLNHLVPSVLSKTNFATSQRSSQSDPHESASDLSTVPSAQAPTQAAGTHNLTHPKRSSHTSTNAAAVPGSSPSSPSDRGTTRHISPPPTGTAPSGTAASPDSGGLDDAPGTESGPHSKRLASATFQKLSSSGRHPAQSADMFVPEPITYLPLSSKTTTKTNTLLQRTDSISSGTGTTHSKSTGSGTMASSENLGPSSGEGSQSASAIVAQTRRPSAVQNRPFIVRNGRTYISDNTLSYPLPVDLQELHRQSLRTLLLFQLFGGPATSEAFGTKPPGRVLEVGCGSGFWSMMCHRYYARHGHSKISFTGLDIVPLCGSGSDPNSMPDKDMNWRFIQHDMRQIPWPLKDEEFDLIMVKDCSFTASGSAFQTFMDEYLRVLKPGGVLEIWEEDLTIRMLRPHQASNVTSNTIDDYDSDDSDSEADEPDASQLGAYVITANTPLSAPLNPFLVEYNGWLTKALEKRLISPVPCTVIGPAILQEPGLIDVRSKRLAIPLSEVRWEREGVGGVVTKDGKTYIDSMKGKGKAGDAPSVKGGKALSAQEAAIRRTALETSIGLIQALEPILREVSGKSQDEWDTWAGKMMNDLLKEDGTSWGECLEVGAWCAKKKK